MQYVDHFNSLKCVQRRQAASYFAKASVHLGNWELLDLFLKDTPDQRDRFHVLTAFSCLHKQQYSEVDSWVDKGFSLLASRPITFWADSQHIYRNTMIVCQELVEVLEMTN
jgi:hypothetical protein